MSTPSTVEEYLAGVPDDARQALEALRTVIGNAAPGATETISYGVPTFKLGKSVVGYGAARKHCALYVMSPATVEAFAAELEPYDTSKGTVRFTPESPLPSALVTKLVKARIRENEAARQA